MRALDWSTTAIGPVDRWSSALQMQVRFLLSNRFPLLLWWGPTFCSIYNDAYMPILGTKHPWALGQPVSECWSEIWDVLKPLIEVPFNGGPATWIEDLEVEINRHGYREEGHFTVAYSPVPDETAPRGIGGVIATVHEISGTVFGERRIAALRDLAAHAGKARSAEHACTIAAETLAAYDKDLPFVLIYLIDRTSHSAQLAGAAGTAIGADISPLTAALGAAPPNGWPFTEATRTALVVERLAERFSALPRGPWSDPPHTAVVMPIPSAKPDEPLGVFVAGVSSRLRLDAHYRDFLDLLTAHLATAITNARLHEEERQRAEALAALDQAKTAFFSNVSHEFRTPLTLLLGPLEDVLRAPALPAAQRVALEVAHRNAGRLLRLVNTLLDFSRIEAGRLDATFAPVDVAALTEDLASVFRSAVERAGLSFSVRCAPPTSPVFLDRDLWEKVVLNLLSNAFKFTLHGGITVTLGERDGMVALAVADTGVGIPAAELPHVFQRFHRVAGSEGRTHEGTGIGLALVHELVKLHGGSVRVDSALGRGSTFTVEIPTGSAHLPPERIGATRVLASTAVGAAPFVEEALRWLPESDRGTDEIALDGAELASVSTAGATILVADDNADMRAYLVRLLSQYWRVEAVADGAAALASIRRQRPDLVLSDVMMPRLDGAGLLQALRSDDALRSVPMILLSARAGEESRVEGLQSGADDYLVKPFSARELLARVNSTLELARLRREALEAVRRSEEALRQADRRKDEFLAMLGHELRNPLAPIRTAVQVLRLLGVQEPHLNDARDIIDRQVTHICRLVDDLLDVSRITSGKIELRQEQVSVFEVIEMAVEATRQSLDAAAHTLSVNAGQDVWVEGDRARLVQIFINLLTNAAKFTPPGGHIGVYCDCRDGRVSISVRDTGIGILAAAHERIFDLFQQEDVSLERAAGGLGIGLTLVKRIAEMHGGSVRVFSAGRGKGAEFVVTLPLHEAAPPQVETAAATPGRVAGPLLVLIVEDHEDAAASLQMLLELYGHVARVARNGVEALRMFEEMRPDVAFIDLGLPGIDGFGVAQRIHTAGGKRPLLVALSGYGQEEDKRRAQAAGFDVHMTKPLDLDRLKAVLLSLVGATDAGERSPTVH